MQLLVWTLDQQQYALALATVDRVVRAVAVTALPGAPDIVSGMINVHGTIIPVVNMRHRLGLPPRAIDPDDTLVLARTLRRPVAFFVDLVSRVAHYPDTAVIATPSIAPGSDYIAGVAKLADGMTLIHDLDRFLSLDEEAAIEQALHP
jgi:purine-binding chemotaxis protein CheW